MKGLLHLLPAAILVTGLVGHADAQTRRVLVSPSAYGALFEGRSVAVGERGEPRSAPVSPSVSHTVMGLSVPR